MSHLISRRVQLNYPAERDLHSGGYLVVELKGDPDDLAAALEWLELTEIAVEELGV
jgi:hypothetical protein